MQVVIINVTSISIISCFRLFLLCALLSSLCYWFRALITSTMCALCVFARTSFCALTHVKKRQATQSAPLLSSPSRLMRIPFEIHTHTNVHVHTYKHGDNRLRARNTQRCHWHRNRNICARAHTLTHTSANRWCTRGTSLKSVVSSLWKHSEQLAWYWVNTGVLKTTMPTKSLVKGYSNLEASNGESDDGSDWRNESRLKPGEVYGPLTQDTNANKCS